MAEPSTFAEMIFSAFPKGIPSEAEFDALPEYVEPEPDAPVNPPKAPRPARGTPEYAEFVKDLDPVAVRTIEEYEDAQFAAALRGSGRLIRAEYLLNLPEPTWLIDKTVPDTGVGQIYGPTYTAKTYLALDMALSVANGKRAWFGRPIGRSGPVVYVLMEGSWDFGRRIKAWLSVNGGTADNLYILNEEELNLSDQDSVRQLEHDITAAGISPVMVVVDTQALATAGVEENSNTDMGLVFANLKRLSKRLDAFVWTVHHTGHDVGRARGASAQKAALDVEMSVTRDRTVTVSKVKAYMPWTAPVPFQITTVGSSAVVTMAGPAVPGPVGTVLEVADGRTGKEIAVVLGKREDAVRQELADHVEQGLLTTEKDGRRTIYRKV